MATIITRFVCMMTLAAMAILGLPLAAQVQTEVPPILPVLSL
jgi:hypothetical protein